MKTKEGICQHKQLAMGMEPRTMAKGGMVSPRKVTRPAIPTQRTLPLTGMRSPLTKLKMRTPPVEERKGGGRADNEAKDTKAHERKESPAFEKKEERK